MCDLVGLAYRMKGCRWGLHVMEPDQASCISEYTSREQPDNLFTLPSFRIVPKLHDHPHSNGGLALRFPNLKILERVVRSIDCPHRCLGDSMLDPRIQIDFVGSAGLNFVQYGVQMVEHRSLKNCRAPNRTQGTAKGF